MRRQQLSKPVLTALFSCRANSIRLVSLRRVVGRVIARRAGKRAKYLPPKVFFAGVKGRMRLVKALQKLLERRVISFSDEELFRKMASASSEADFDQLWRVGGKDVEVHINKERLIRLAVAKKKVKQLALDLLRKNQSLSVGQAITLAKRKLKAEKGAERAGDKELEILSQVVLQVLKSEPAPEVSVRELMQKLIDCKAICSYPTLIKALLRLRKMKLIQLYDMGKPSVRRYYEVVRIANNRSLKPLTRRNKIRERVEHFSVKVM